MRLFRSRPTSGPRPKFVPCFEALEDRSLMSVTTSILPGGGILRFAGDAAADYIEVRDSGQPGTGNVSYRFSSTDTFHVIPEEIWKVEIDSGDGNDTVLYDMMGNMTFGRYRELFANLGAGSDRFTGTVRGSVTGPDNRYGLHLIANGGSGNDISTVTMRGDVLQRGDLGISLAGEQGVDFLTVDLSNDVDVAPGARVWVNMSGQENNDNVNLSYRGELDGLLLFHLEGNSGSDWVVANLTLDAGSSGRVGDPNTPSGWGYPTSAARVLGGDGSNDTVEFCIQNNSGGGARIAAELYGGAGTDSFVFTPLWVNLVDWAPGESQTRK